MQHDDALLFGIFRKLGAACLACLCVCVKCEHASGTTAYRANQPQFSFFDTAFWLCGTCVSRVAAGLPQKYPGWALSTTLHIIQRCTPPAYSSVSSNIIELIQAQSTHISLRLRQTDGRSSGPSVWAIYAGNP